MLKLNLLLTLFFCLIINCMGQNTSEYEINFNHPEKKLRESLKESSILMETASQEITESLLSKAHFYTSYFSLHKTDENKVKISFTSEENMNRLVLHRLFLSAGIKNIKIDNRIVELHQFTNLFLIQNNEK
jgi:translation elongation factor EF-G